MKSFVQFVSCKSSKSVETIPNSSSSSSNNNNNSIKRAPTDRPNSAHNRLPQNCSYSKNTSQTCPQSQSLSNQSTKPKTKPLIFQNSSASSILTAVIPKIMPQVFEDKIILVTGSSGGIGAATVKYFAQAGAKVVVNGRNQNNIAMTAAECDALSPKKYKALQIQGDVTKPEDCQRIIDTVVSHFGGLDVLVNNAGAGAFGSIYDPRLIDTLQSQIRLNVTAMVQITQMAVPELEKRAGVIVNISSTLSQKPNVHFMPYCVAKASVDMFTKCLALELGPKGVRVNCVNPTAVRTNFQAATGAGEALEGVLKHLEETNPLRRIGTTEDVVNAIAFLASSEAGFITGHSLVVDGGSIYV